MGVFDCNCTESGLVIDDEVRLVAILETTSVKGGFGTWEPIGLPVAGEYDSYGTIGDRSEKPRLGVTEKALLAIGRLLVFNDTRYKGATIGFKDLLDEIRGDGSGAKHAGNRVSFALIEERVFQAIVNVVRENGATAWRRFAQLGLNATKTPLPDSAKKPVVAKPDAVAKRLCEAILAKPKDAAARQVYIDHLLERDDPRGKLLALLPALDKAKAADLIRLALPHTPIAAELEQAALKKVLLDFVRFRAWGTRWLPAWSVGQVDGYKTEFESAKPYCDRATKIYEGMPELLEVVAANIAAWKERQADFEDD
jgi:uncharacterized protein (TIGR02996 family)